MTENINQEIAYTEKQLAQEKEYESKCKRCGSCCGAFGGDPCNRLVKEEDGKYSCSVYETRIGKQYTISGKEFYCVLIRYLRPQLPYPNCAYYRKS